MADSEAAATTEDPKDQAAKEGEGEPKEKVAPPAEEAKAPAPKAKAQAKAAFKPAYRTGQRVILHSLKTEELNGHRGIIVKWKEDVGRYAVRIAGKEMGIKPENIKPEGGVAEAMKFQKKYGNTEGVMYNPVVYMRTPGAGPKMTQWIGQVKAGRRVVVRAEKSPEFDEEPIPLWFGDRGFIGSKPVDVALLINDIGGDVSEWPKAIARVLDRFPAAAGRLREVNRRTADRGWQIVLNNAGVPFTTASVPPCGLPKAEDLQLACGDDQCGFFDLGLEDGDLKNGGEEPLLRLKLIYEEGTERGLLGVSFHHALCDISGIGAMLRFLHSELDSTVKAPSEVPCFDRAAAQEVFQAVPDPTPEEEGDYAPHWPLWGPALERWCFFARRLRSGLRGRPDGASSLFFSVPAQTVTELKKEAAEGGEPAASAFDVLVTYIGMKLLRLRRLGHCTLITKDYRAALHASAPDKGLDQLFANVVTHGVSFQMPSVQDVDMMPLGEACSAMRKAVDAVSLGYVHWQSKQDHFRGLPNMFGGLCCNTWGRALADIGFVETYAIGLRSVDERAANMTFPLDAAYLQIFPQPSGAHSVLLTAPLTDIEALMKELPSTHFDVPHVSQLRPHPFKVPLPAKVVDELNPTVETHHMYARIACIGDSITNSVDDGGTPHGYPDVLQKLFDRAEIRVKVRNFGKFSTTAQKFSECPYWDERRMEAARLWRPHFVIATFGHNDAKESQWDMAAFEKDYAELCLEFLERMSPRPFVFLVAPPPVYKPGAYDIQQEVVNKELQEAVARVAHAAERTMNAPMEEMAKRTRKPVPEEVLAHTAVIDAFNALGGAELKRPSYMAEDGVHPNERGTKLLALTVFADVRPPSGVSVLNTPRSFIIAAHDLNGPWLKLYEDKPSDFPPPRPVDAPAPAKGKEEAQVINDKESLYAMHLERRNSLHIESESCFGRRGPLYIVACAVNSSIYDDAGLWHDLKGEPGFQPGQKVNGPPFNDRCLAVAGRCGMACVSQQRELPFCTNGVIHQEVLAGHVDLEFNRVPAVIAFVCVLLCGFAVKSLMLCPGIFSPYRHAHAYEPEMTESFKYIVVVSPVAGADENKGTMLRNLIGVVSGMPPDCRCRYHAVINDEGHRNEMKSCWMLFCKVVELIPNFGYRTYEENLLEFMHLWCQETKILSLAQIGGKVKNLEPVIIDRLSGRSTLMKLLKESKWSTFDKTRLSSLDAACQALAEDLSNNYNKFTLSVPYLDNIGDWSPKDPSSTALRLHYTSRAKPVEDSRNIMVQHVAVGSWFYKVPRHATTEDWLQLRTNSKEMVYAVPDRDSDSYNVPLRSSHGKAGGLNFVDNYMALVARRPENIYHDIRDESPTLYAIADARHQFQPDFMLSCIPCFFTEDGDLNHQVAFTQAPQHYPEYMDKDDYMDYNNAQFFRLNAMIRNCCGGVSSCGTNGMWLLPAREDDTIWMKRRKRVRDRDSKKRDELIEREQFHTSCKIEDTASSLDQVLVGRHSHFVNRKLSFGMAKAPTDFIGAQQRWVEGAVTLSLQWFTFNADAHGQAAKNAWMLWLTVITFFCFLGALFGLVCYAGDITQSMVSQYWLTKPLFDSLKDALTWCMSDDSSLIFKILGGNQLNHDVFVSLFLQFFLWMLAFTVAFLCLWFVTMVCKCFKKCCYFPNEMRWWGRLIISMDNLTYFIWFWTSFFWIGFNYYCALFKMNYHFNNKGMMAFMLAVNIVNWSMIICNTFRYNIMESMDANEIAALNMDNIWRSNQLFFMTGPIQLFSFVRGIGEFIKYKFYGQDIGGWSGGDLGTISVNIVKYWTSLMLLGCVGVWIAFALYAHEYQNSFSACIVVTLISLDVLHPCAFLWLGNVKLPKEDIDRMSWCQCLMEKRWWQVKVKDFILNTTFTGILKYIAPGYFLLLPFLALFSSYFGVSGAYMLVAMGPGH